MRIPQPCSSLSSTLAVAVTGSKASLTPSPSKTASTTSPWILKVRNTGLILPTKVLPTIPARTATGRHAASCCCARDWAFPAEQSHSMPTGTFPTTRWQASTRAVRKPGLTKKAIPSMAAQRRLTSVTTKAANPRAPAPVWCIPNPLAATSTLKAATTSAGHAQKRKS